MTNRQPRPGEPWHIRSTTTSYRATGILRMACTTDQYEWVIVAEDGRSHLGGSELPDGWELVAPWESSLPTRTTAPSPPAGSADPLLQDAARLVVQTQFGSAAMLRRHLGVSYPRAEGLLLTLEQAGLVAPPSPRRLQAASPPRRVLVDAGDVQAAVDRIAHIQETPA
ncbi:FtsK-like DNA translocase [Gordonia phage Doggs]|nr:FtsK-like DNA translocase [Gordonia phage Doggs]